MCRTILQELQQQWRPEESRYSILKTNAHDTRKISLDRIRLTNTAWCIFYAISAIIRFLCHNCATNLGGELFHSACYWNDWHVRRFRTSSIGEFAMGPTSSSAKCNSYWSPAPKLPSHQPQIMSHVICTLSYTLEMSTEWKKEKQRKYKYITSTSSTMNFKLWADLHHMQGLLDYVQPDVWKSACTSQRFSKDLHMMLLKGVFPSETTIPWLQFFPCKYWGYMSLKKSNSFEYSQGFIQIHSFPYSESLGVDNDHVQ